MNRSYLLIGVSAALLAASACSRQEAANTGAADETLSTVPSDTAPSAPTDGTTMPEAAPQSTPGAINPDGSTANPDGTTTYPDGTTSAPSDTTSAPPQS